MSWERDFVKVLLLVNLDLQANYHLVYRIAIYQFYAMGAILVPTSLTIN